MPSSPEEKHDETPIISLPAAILGPHTTCPPEDDRVHHSPREHRASLDARTRAITTLSADATPHQLPTPETDGETGVEESETTDTVERRMQDVDEALMQDAPSPESADGQPKDSDARLAQSMSATALSPDSREIWPIGPLARQRVTANSSSSFLRPGSKFVGTQQSDRQVYNVQVEIKNVDMEQSFLCGYLRIQGLTDDHPTLTTYFEGEIVGNKHTFKTAHPEWGSSEKVDMQHWARFQAWRPLAKQAKSPGFTFKNFAQRQHLFMRWKEYFLVPDHKVKTITGASFEGFYYICFNQHSGSVSGIYFHAKSEKYQQLELEHVRDRGCVAAMEFR